MLNTICFFKLKLLIQFAAAFKTRKLMSFFIFLIIPLFFC